MTEPIKLTTDAVRRWSLERVQFLLSQLEGFIDDEAHELRERAKQFQAQMGLDNVQSLSTLEPSDPLLPIHLMDRLSPFFEAGLLIQRAPSQENGAWWVTDLFWRGTSFHLDVSDQVKAGDLIPEITPLQVHRAPAAKILERVGLSYLCQTPDADGFLLKPTPLAAFVLISTLPKPWTEDHLSHAHRLINKAFLY